MGADAGLVAGGAGGLGGSAGVGAGGWSSVAPVGGAAGSGAGLQGSGGMFGGIMDKLTGKNVMNALANSDLTFGQGAVWAQKVNDEMALLQAVIGHPATAVPPNSGQTVPAASIRTAAPWVSQL